MTGGDQKRGLDEIVEIVERDGAMHKYHKNRKSYFRILKFNGLNMTFWFVVVSSSF